MTLKQCGQAVTIERRPVAVERLDVRRGQHLVDVVVAHPPRRIAGARFLLAEDREANAGRVEAGREGPRHASIALVERGRATHPVQDLDLGRAARRGRGRRPSGPRTAARASSRCASTAAGPTGSRPAPCSGRRSSAPAGTATPPGRGSGAGPTILSTCSMSTGHASTHAPQVTQSHTASYGIASSTMGFASAAGFSRSSRPYVSRTIGRVRDQVEAVLGLVAHVPDAHDEGLRVERLAGVPGRTGVLAAAALGAREAVEEVLPAEVLERLQRRTSRLRARGPSPAARRAAGACGSRR